MSEESAEESAMEIEEARNRKCPFCNGNAQLEQCGGKMFWKWSCKCGLTSRLFSDRWDAKEWFNMRAGRLIPKFARPKIEVGARVNKISGVEIKDGVVERTPEDVGHIPHPQEELDQVQKDADQQAKTTVSMAEGKEEKKRSSIF
jgi:hypothetical protein